MAPSNREMIVQCDPEEQAGRQTPQKAGQGTARCNLYILGTICVVLLIAGVCAGTSMWKNISSKIEEQMNNLKNLQQFVFEITRWRQFGSKFYYFSETKSTWEKAREQCVAMGATLAMVKTREEMEFLARVNTGRHWLGLSDTGAEGTWKWLDGTFPAKELWLPGEPNNDLEENCGEMRGRLNDAPCNIQKPWICERSAVI
ncbi:CD209 antigen-like protein C [Anguilla rostrata]|uniref:CD209 antigen-like protein C n=1 Tax=Anguilla rostrata TaxID=7938 RepID=UPI0030D01F52